MYKNSLVIALFALTPVIHAASEEKRGALQGKQYHVETSQGKMNVWDSQNEGKPVLLIHGNSACGQVFSKQFESLGDTYRLLAIDLFAHGKSDPAKDLETYSFSGYANAIAELVASLKLQDLAIVGWSLGGHIALELYDLLPNIKGILITGAPPISLSPEGIQKGFKPFEGLALMGQETPFSRDEAIKFNLMGGFDMHNDPDLAFLIEASMGESTGIARKNMMEAIAQGKGKDETEIVKRMTIPLAIIAGQHDIGINNDYIAHEVTYNNLWKNKVHMIDAGHAVVWEKAPEFNKILKQFLEDIFKK